MAGADREQERLIEEATTAWRPRGSDGDVLAHPAWADLDDTARRRVFEETVISRALEAALHPGGLSTTVRAVLSRIPGGEQAD